MTMNLRQTKAAECAKIRLSFLDWNEFSEEEVEALCQMLDFPKGDVDLILQQQFLRDRKSSKENDNYFSACCADKNANVGTHLNPDAIVFKPHWPAQPASVSTEPTVPRLTPPHSSDVVDAVGKWKGDCTYYGSTAQSNAGVPGSTTGCLLHGTVGERVVNYSCPDMINTSPSLSTVLSERSPTTSTTTTIFSFPGAETNWMTVPRKSTAVFPPSTVMLFSASPLPAHQCSNVAACKGVATAVEGLKVSENTFDTAAGIQCPAVDGTGVFCQPVSTQAHLVHANMSGERILPSIRFAGVSIPSPSPYQAAQCVSGHSPSVCGSAVLPVDRRTVMSYAQCTKRGVNQATKDIGSLSSNGAAIAMVSDPARVTIPDCNGCVRSMSSTASSLSQEIVTAFKEMSSSFDATPRAVLRKHLVGLKNDNRKCCYLNSAVQALYSLTEYRHLMDTAVLCLRGTQLSVLRNHAPLFKACIDLHKYLGYLSDEPYHIEEIRAAFFTYFLKNKTTQEKLSEMSREQDVHEAFDCLRCSINTEFQTIAESATVGHAEEDGWTVHTAKKAKKRWTSVGSPPMDRIFQSMVLDPESGCDGVTDSYFRIMNLLHDGVSMSVEDSLLDVHNAPEMRRKFHRLPRVLVMQPALVSDGKKVHSGLHLPPQLTIPSDALSSECNISLASRRYQLKTVVFHYGMEQERGGHFTTCARQPDGLWVEYSDERLRDRTEEQVLYPQDHQSSRIPALIFYEQLQPFA